MEFNYKIKTGTGELLEGKIAAPDEKTAVDTLQSKGYIILSLNEISGSIFAIDLNLYLSRPNNKDIVIFTRQLSTLIDADMPLVEGLRTLSKQTEKPALKKILLEVSGAVESGSSLSGALSKHPKLFSSFYIKLVQSGEVSGKLHESLLYLSEHLERSQTINSKITGALAYPAFILFALIVVTTIMMVYVLPQLLSIFKEVGADQLPITTRVLMAVTAFVNKYLYLIGITLVGGGYFFWRYLETEEGTAWFDNLKINIPYLGFVVRNLYLARIAESLSTLIKAGIPILDNIRITSDLVGNVSYKKILLEAEESIRDGGNMSQVFMRHSEIPPLMASMVAIGEKTGKLDFILEHVSKFYKAESENTIDTISQLIEPIMVLILGFAVAILVSAILLPIYNLVGVG